MSTKSASPRAAVSASNLLAENVRIYLQVRSAFEQCHPDIQAAIQDMIAIVEDQSATEEERQRALNTIVEGLFPSLAADFLNACDETRLSKDAQASWEALGREEASFSANLLQRMAEQNMTQEELARRIGVGQPAIANLLNRNCRPQRKTVLRMAEALGVAPSDLWAQFQADG